MTYGPVHARLGVLAFAGPHPDPQAISVQLEQPEPAATVRLAATQTADGITLRFLADGDPAVLAAADWLCEHWRDSATPLAPSATQLLDALGLGRAHAGSVLIVSRAAAALLNAMGITANTEQV